MKEQILEMLKPLSVEEQNVLILEIRNAIKDNRWKQANALEAEALRIKQTMNKI